MLVTASPTAWAQCRYELSTITNEPASPGIQRNVLITALNDLGQAAGVANGKVFVWTQDEGMIELDAPGQPLFSDFPTAVAMNNITGVDGIGQLVCNLRVASPFQTVQAFIYDDGIWTPLSEDFRYSTSARGFNDLGQIAGDRDTPKGGVHFRWEHGVFTDFDEPFGNSSVRALNKAGTVVGSTVVDDFLFTWNGDDVVLLPALATDSEAAYPFYLNSAGHIAGDLYLTPSPGKTTTYASRAFFLNGDDITWFSVDGFPNSQAYGLNDMNQIVLQVYYADQTGSDLDFFLWQNGTYTRLLDLIELEQQIEAFQFRVSNNHGQIAGWYYNQPVGAPNTSELLGAILTPINRPLGDVDCDCTVGAHDLANVLRDWGVCSGLGVCPSDIVSSRTLAPPGDGVVDGADLAVVLGNWGASTAVR